MSYNNNKLVMKELIKVMTNLPQAYLQLNSSHN